MFVGHLGVGLAARAVEPKLGLGTLFAAAMLLDLVLWSFVLMHVEAAIVPADYAAHHYLLFNFPWSHSLLGALLLSFAAAAGWAALKGRGEIRQRLFSFAALVLGSTVFLHWLLDALVHPPQLPLAPGGASLGLDLWDHQPLALVLELAIAVAGLWFYWMRAATPRRFVVLAVVLVAATLTIAGALSASPPPRVSLIAYVSLVTIGLTVAVAAWADQPWTVVQTKRAGVASGP